MTELESHKLLKLCWKDGSNNRIWAHMGTVIVSFIVPAQTSAIKTHRFCQRSWVRFAFVSKIRRPPEGGFRLPWARINEPTGVHKGLQDIFTTRVERTERMLSFEYTPENLIILERTLSRSRRGPAIYLEHVQAQNRPGSKGPKAPD